MVIFWNKYINNYILKIFVVLCCFLLGKVFLLVVVFGFEFFIYIYFLCFLRIVCFGVSGVGGGVISLGIVEEYVGVWIVFFGLSGIETSGVVGGFLLGVSGVFRLEIIFWVVIGRFRLGDGVGIEGKVVNFLDFLFFIFFLLFWNGFFFLMVLRG